MAIGPNVVDDCEGMTEEDYWRGMDEAMQEEEGDEPFCNCTTGHSIEETDWNQCDSCGKPIYDEEPAVPPAPTFAEGTEKMNVVRQSKDRCSYKCPYYQDGPVLSLCNKHKKQLRYDGKIPPLLTEECKAEMVPHNVLADRPAAPFAAGRLD